MTAVIILWALFVLLNLLRMRLDKIVNDCERKAAEIKRGGSQDGWF